MEKICISGKDKGGAPERLFDPGILADPHAFLKDLRAAAPVACVTDPDGRDIYLVTSHRLIDEVSSRSDVFSSAFGHLLMAGSGDSEVQEILARDWIEPALLLISDDPEHRRYRVLVNAVFAMGRIANLAPAIDRIVDELIDRFIERGEVDFVNEFAVLLPTYVVADILGLKREDYDKVRCWSDAIIRIVSRIGSREQQVEAAHAVQEFRQFILGTIRARRKQPEDDLISHLIAVRLDGVRPLTDEEIAPLSFEISVAGNETTRNVLMSGMVRLLKNPDQLAALRADRTLINNAVEELLRYETPATSMWRIARTETTLDGVPIPAGATVLLRYDAGNRDDALFEEPDRFDITRKNARRHQAFGGEGVHRCLGQMLARKELQIAIPKLLERLEGLHVIEEGSDTEYWPGLLHRGITALHLGFDNKKAVLF